MIKSPTECFFIVDFAEERAGELIARISPRTQMDIRSAVICSGEYDNDIECLHDMRELMYRHSDLEDTTHNPLYLPNRAGIEAVLELQENGQYAVMVDPQEVHSVRSEGVLGVVKRLEFDVPDARTMTHFKEMVH